MFGLIARAVLSPLWLEADHSDRIALNNFAPLCGICASVSVCVCCVSCMGGLLLHSGSIFCWLCSVVEMRLLHSGTVGKLLLSFLHWLTGVGFVVVQKNDVIDLFSDRAYSHYDAYQSDSFSILRINLSLSPLHRSTFKMHYSRPLFLLSNIHFCCFPAWDACIGKSIKHI